MRQFKATAVTTLFGGNLELDKDQLRRRRHLVTENEDGTHAIDKSVMFKAGEEFGYDGDIPKSLADCMTELVDEPVVELVDEYPVHKGAGIFVLSNGEKVKGKVNAIAAEAELAEVEPEDTDPDEAED